MFTSLDEKTKQTILKVMGREAGQRAIDRLLEEAAQEQAKAQTKADATLIATSVKQLRALGYQIATKGAGGPGPAGNEMLVVRAGMLRALGPAGARYVEKALQSGHIARVAARKQADPAEDRVQRKLAEAKEAGHNGALIETGLRALYAPAEAEDRPSSTMQQALSLLHGQPTAQAKEVRAKQLALLDQRLREAGVDPDSPSGQALKALYGPLEPAAAPENPEYAAAVAMLHGKGD